MYFEIEFIQTIITIMLVIIAYLVTKLSEKHK